MKKLERKLAADPETLEQAVKLSRDIDPRDWTDLMRKGYFTAEAVLLARLWRRKRHGVG